MGDHYIHLNRCSALIDRTAAHVVKRSREITQMFSVFTTVRQCTALIQDLWLRESCRQPLKALWYNELTCLDIFFTTLQIIKCLVIWSRNGGVSWSPANVKPVNLKCLTKICHHPAYKDWKVAALSNFQTCETMMLLTCMAQSFTWQSCVSLNPGTL